jgi:hypothetical protein
MRRYMPEIDSDAIDAYNIINEENGGLQLGLNGSTGEIENNNAVTEYEFHPLADLFPLVEGAAFDELVADIKEHGLADPIVLFEDKILDGRNRYRALQRLGLGNQLRSEVYSGTDPLAFVISKNLKRRHLDESGRAMVAAKLATLKLGDNQHSEGPSIGEASKLLNVSPKSVERARVVQNDAVPELRHAVEQGHLAVSLAAQAAKLPEEQQRDIAAKAEAGEANVVRAVVKKERRAQREVEPQPAKADNTTESPNSVKPPATPEQTAAERKEAYARNEAPPSSAPPASTRKTDDAAKLIGCLRGVEGLLNHDDPESIVRAMSADDAKDVRRLAPLVVEWLSLLSKPISPNIAT